MGRQSKVVQNNSAWGNPEDDDPLATTRGFLWAIALSSPFWWLAVIVWLTR